MIKMLEESDGVLSSKRVMGAVTMIGGLLLLIAVGIMALIKKELFVNADTAISAGTALVGIGAGLLGITVLEGIGKK
jgi:hypothetical protein